MKLQFNTRIEYSTLTQVNELKTDLGISQADVIRLAVRAMHRKELGSKRKFLAKSRRKA